MKLLDRIRQLFRRKKPVKLGLALGSGGAKGMAHLGALKAFEEEGISFDVITGSSIGSIVGALYAKGYTSDDMKGIVEGLSRKEFARNLVPLADLSFAREFLSGYLDGDFTALKKPFAALATDGDSNEAVVLDSGDLLYALTASSAYPPFFRGVEIGEKKYYDGGFSNAVPADVCKNLGAERVVAIDLSAYARSNQEEGFLGRLLGSALGALVPVHTLPDAKSRGYGAADIMLRPDLREFRPTDISREATDKMYEIGYAEAKAHIPELKELLKRKK